MGVLRWGICSAGKISQDFSYAVSSLEGHKVQAVAARSKQDARDLAAKVGAETVYEGYEPLTTDPSIDVVYVGSVNTQHFPLCKLFLEAKKHVLCEKPLGLHAAEVSALIDIARSNNCFFMEGIWSRFFPSYEKIRSILANGEIGDVKFITGDFCLDIKCVPRLQNKDTGGGGLYDLGIYLVQLATMVFGPNPVSVKGTGSLMDTGVGEICCMTLEFPGKKFANMVTAITAFSSNEALIVGSKGRIKLTSFFHTTTRIEVQRGAPSPGLCETEVFDFPLPDSNRPFNYGNSVGLQYEAAAVKHAIDEGKTEHPVMPWSESLAICKILDKLRHDLGYYRLEEERSEPDDEKYYDRL